MLRVLNCESVNFINVSAKDYDKLKILNVLVRHNEYAYRDLLNILSEYSGLPKSKLILLIMNYLTGKESVEECYENIVSKIL